MSNTIFYAEHAVSLLIDDTDRTEEGPQMGGGWYGSTIFTSYYPINLRGKVNDEYGGRPARAVLVKRGNSSMHPGGVNTVFVDGSSSSSSRMLIDFVGKVDLDGDPR